MAADELSIEHQASSIKLYHARISDAGGMQCLAKEGLPHCHPCQSQMHSDAVTFPGLARGAYPRLPRSI